MIGGGLLAIALVVVLVLVNLPVQSAEIVPTNVSSLPDLAITSAYVSMVDANGRCLPYYGFNVTVVNQGNAPAPDVTLAETNTGQEVHIGTLNPLQSLSMPFVAKAASGAYTVIADPHNIIVESNESNNSATFSEATATPVAACLPLQFGDGTPASVSTPVPVQAQPTTIQQVTPEPTIISTPQNNSVIDLESPRSVILKSSDINTSNLLKVDDGLEISDRSDCLPKDCAFSVWKILEPDSLALSVSNSTLQLVISLRSFQTPEDANSDAEKTIGENGGRPGYRLIEVPVNILPDQSWAYAHDGWFVVVTTTYENMEIGVSLSGSTGGINDSEKAAALLANLAKMQIDKLMLAKNK